MRLKKCQNTPTFRYQTYLLCVSFGKHLIAAQPHEQKSAGYITTKELFVCKEVLQDSG